MTTTTASRSIGVSKGMRLGSITQKFSTLAVLVLLFLGFALGTDRFFTGTNLVNILQQISMLTIVAVGLTFGFAAKEMDLSVGYVVGLGGLLAPLLMVSGVPIPIAILAALGAGLLVGLINSTLVVGVGVPSLIATLAAGSILWGINFMISGGRAIYGGIPSEYLFVGQGKIGGFLPYPALFMLIIVAGSWFVMERTTFGRYLYAVGGNARAAELSGIKVRSYRVFGLALSSLFAAISGVILSARLGSGQPNGGDTYLLDGLAAVFIGMTMLRPGTATVMGTFFGALLIGIMNNGLNLMGMDTYVQSIVKGFIIVIAVSVVSRTTRLRLL
ncbi:ABC transporter permease [Methylovirgula sp. 4M-Z18]|uniref:ABC transporter permease n=1 Tax=Methylovirgula sp. 4M-Z18 TaxID=2293567 RepID=UPI000E2F4B99|nr:ABC transporter permease [Methylovirgula sp. 4M-Z18]RFB74953.1 ABC transporter permease [Methylovirgula sp. 4M-Z18]